MEPCVFCQAEEALVTEYGVPICRRCLGNGKPGPHRNASVCSALVRDLTEATAQFESAFIEFNSAMGDIPSHFPHQDGTQRIHNISHALAAARKNRQRAHERLDNYLSRGIVPNDGEWGG